MKEFVILTVSLIMSRSNLGFPVMNDHTLNAWGHGLFSPMLSLFFKEIKKLQMCRLNCNGRLCNKTIFPAVENTPAEDIRNTNAKQPIIQQLRGISVSDIQTAESGRVHILDFILQASDEFCLSARAIFKSSTA